ncbi:hypothetical protein LMG29542_00098 [Paraburkholderia humisilvae]|uniref:Uncharacterized protein n=1 Tax=Paraburkholderia humisilvae TaxID=627669 RepID=A0A6J5CYF2_9BURK|nr:hypothetical protein LMG29542_00098 [Paraburkholderia humisilvae]
MHSLSLKRTLTRLLVIYALSMVVCVARCFCAMTHFGPGIVARADLPFGPGSTMRKPHDQPDNENEAGDVDQSEAAE